MEVNVVLPTMTIPTMSIQKKLNPEPINFDEIYQNIYDNYETVIECTTEVFKSALKTTYNAYNNILKCKNDNVEKFNDIIGNKCYENEDICVSDKSLSPNDSIRHIINKIIFKYHDCSRILCNSEYDENAENLNNYLNTKCDYYGEKLPIPVYGIENSHEIRPSNNRTVACVLDTVIFKIRPMLDKIVLGIDNKPIPVLQHLKVLYDYISVCNFCLCNSDFVENPEEVITEEIFINNNIIKMNSVIQDLSKKIILEMFDRISDIYGNFDKFNDKLKCVSRELRGSDAYQNILRKMEWMKKTNVKETNPLESKCEIDQFNKLIDDDVLKLVFDNYCNNCVDMEPDIEVPTSFYDIDINSYGFDKKPLGLLIYYYNFAFNHYFEDEVLVEYCHYNSKFLNDNIVKNTKETFYSREFDKKYNYSDLMNQTAKISDYNLRDFYQTIISDTNKTSEFSLFEFRMNRSNERETFLNSKYKRVWIIYVFGFVTLFKKMLDNYPVTTDGDFKRSDVYDRINETVRSTFEMIVGILSNITVSGFPKTFGTCYNMPQKLRFILKVLENHFKCDIYDLDNIDGKILKMFDKYDCKKTNICYKCDCKKMNICYKYNTNDIETYGGISKFLYDIVRDVIIDF